MHISEGVLTPPVLLAGAAAAAAGLAIGLKRLEYEKVPETAVLSAAFFVASLIHVPVAGANAHLVLNGLLGILLGWAAFPAIFVGAAMQAVMFQFGGLTTLGVNTLTMALPAVIVNLLFARLVRQPSQSLALAAAAAAGALAVALSGLLVAGALIWAGKEFSNVAKVILVAHLPIMAAEAIITAFAVGFLRQVKPELLEIPSVAQP